MSVDWSAFGQVAWVSVGTTVGVVTVFALGVLAYSRYETERERGEGGTVALAGVGLALLVCFLVVLYGLYLIIPQFHD